MKTVELFKLRKIPIITIMIVLTCCVITGLALYNNKFWNIFSLKVIPENIWQYVSGVFLHGTDGAEKKFTIMHLTSTMLMIIPYGLIIEKLLGSKKTITIFLIAWLGFCALFQLLGIIIFLITKESNISGAGASGLGYCFTTIGIYILYKVYRLDKKNFFKQPLNYIFLFGILLMLFILNPFIAGVGSMVLHISGIILGIIIISIYKNDINRNIELSIINKN